MDGLSIEEWAVFPHIYTTGERQGGAVSAPYDRRYEIHYMMKGQCDFFFHDRLYIMRQGDVVLVDAGTLYHIHGTAGQERIVMEIHPDVMEWLDQILPYIEIESLFQVQSPLLRLTTDLRKRVESVLKQMLEESATRERGWESIYRTLLAQFFALIRRAREQTILGEGLSHSRTHDKLAQICRCIWDQYARPLTLEAVADAYDVSPCYLSRMFKKLTGLSFSRYRNAVRVSYAQGFLAQAGMPISAVAEQCGFESATHFGRVFKEFTGTTPLKYRKAIRKIKKQKKEAAL
jgi:AraC family transcriptional regulator of arabinose operon